MKTMWLQVFLNGKPLVHLVESTREELFAHDTKKYISRTDYPGSIGHYDWLRRSDGTVVGVRYWPFADLVQIEAIRELVDKCSGLKYVKVEPKVKNISVIFDADAFIDEDNSNDQDLGEIGIYATDEGDYALCFECDIEKPQIAGVT